MQDIEMTRCSDTSFDQRCCQMGLLGMNTNSATQMRDPALLLITMIVVVVIFLVGVAIFMLRAPRWLRNGVGNAFLGVLLVGAGLTGLFGSSQYDSGSTYGVTTRRLGGNAEYRTESGSSLNLQSRIGGGIGLLLGCGFTIRAYLYFRDR